VNCQRLYAVSAAELCAAAATDPRSHRRDPAGMWALIFTMTAPCWSGSPSPPRPSSRGTARITMADPALVELVISSDGDEAARARALRLLGFAAGLPVRIAALRSQVPLDQVGGLVCPARPVKAASLGGVGIILATTLDPAGFPARVRAGIGAAESPDRSWRQARTALRFTPGANRSSATTT
jgi:hypothetical protein